MINIVEKNKNQKHIGKHVGVVDSKNLKRKESIYKNQEKKYGKLLIGEEDEMTIIRSAIS
jgi:hypothetical protein